MRELPDGICTVPQVLLHIDSVEVKRLESQLTDVLKIGHLRLEVPSSRANHFSIGLVSMLAEHKDIDLLLVVYLDEEVLDTVFKVYREFPGVRKYDAGQVELLNLTILF